MKEIDKLKEQITNIQSMEAEFTEILIDTMFQTEDGTLLKMLRQIKGKMDESKRDTEIIKSAINKLDKND